MLGKNEKNIVLLIKH